jgi:hypothetical protein
MTIPVAPAASARERILNAAYELFSRRGIRAVGADEVIERAGCAPSSGHASLIREHQPATVVSAGEVAV